jgi:hypothetical protein
MFMKPMQGVNGKPLNGRGHLERAAALLAGLILPGTMVILLPVAAEAAVIVPQVVFSPQQLHVNLNEGDTAGVRVDIVNLSGPAVRISSHVLSIALISGDQDDGARPMGPSRLRKKGILVPEGAGSPAWANVESITCRR